MFKKVISLSLAALIVIGSVPVISHADESITQNDNSQTIINQQYDSESRLGGGPSPSAAWTYQYTTTKTFTNSQLKTLNTKLQAAVKAGKKTQTAYNAVVFMVGLMGWKGASLSAYLTFCVDTQPNVIQNSANTVATALSKDGSVKLKVKKYIRPANGEVLCVYSGIS